MIAFGRSSPTRGRVFQIPSAPKPPLYGLCVRKSPGSSSLLPSKCQLLSTCTCTSTYTCTCTCTSTYTCTCTCTSTHIYLSLYLCLYFHPYVPELVLVLVLLHLLVLPIVPLFDLQALFTQSAISLRSLVSFRCDLYLLFPPLAHQLFLCNNAISAKPYLSKPLILKLRIC